MAWRGVWLNPQKSSKLKKQRSETLVTKTRAVFAFLLHSKFFLLMTNDVGVYQICKPFFFQWLDNP